MKRILSITLLVIMPPHYYLADGAAEWIELSHGGDGCFGVGDGGSQGMMGKKGRRMMMPGGMRFPF